MKKKGRNTKEEKCQNEKEWKERNPMIKKWLSLEEAEVARKEMRRNKWD